MIKSVFVLWSAGFLLGPDGGGGGGGPEKAPKNPDPGEPVPKDPKEPNPAPGAEPTEREKKLSESLKAREAEIEALKKDRDGQNKKVGELAKKIDAIEKAAMSEDERKTAEEADRAKKAEEENAKFLDQCVALAADKSGLKPEDNFLLSGNDQEEIFRKGDRLKALLAEAEKVGFDRAKKDGVKGTPPAGGEPAGGGAPALGRSPLESLMKIK